MSTPTTTRRWAPPLDVARQQARGVLAEQRDFDPADHHGTITAAATMEVALQHLLDALDAEDGPQ